MKSSEEYLIISGRVAFFGRLHGSGNYRTTVVSSTHSLRRGLKTCHANINCENIRSWLG
jgi:hypothetical protein